VVADDGDAANNDDDGEGGDSRGKFQAIYKQNGPKKDDVLGHAAALDGELDEPVAVGLARKSQPDALRHTDDN
jgi:hypothetical protein